MKRLISTVGLLCVSMALFAQSTDFKNIERPIPLSPRVAELTKHVTIPTSLYTGVTDISIPLFTVEAGSFQIPISLAYHASGMKVTQMETEVGLGWSILGAPFMSRGFTGVADDQPSLGNFESVPPTLTQLQARKAATTYPAITDNFHYLRGMSNNKGQDGEPDQFAISLGDFRSTFYLARNRTNIVLPFLPVPIWRGYKDVNNKYPFFARDMQGNYYTFAAYGTSSSAVITDQYFSTPITSWHVTEIRSQDNENNVAEFSYVNRTVTQTVPYQEQVFGRAYNSGASTVTTSLLPGTIVNKDDVVTHVEPLIRQIKHSGGRVLFEYTAGNELLFRVRVMNLNDEVIDIFNFAYNNLDPTRDRIRLLSLTRTSYQAQEITEVYTFEYSPTKLPSLATNAKYSQDIWGYFNGKTNTGLIAAKTVTGTSIGLTGMTPADLSASYTVGNADRSISESHSKAGMLTKVTFPEGGYKIYDYEANRWMSAVSGTEQVGIGLRIASIKSYDIGNVLVGETQYRYGPADDGRSVRTFNEPNLLKDYRDESMFTFQSNAGSTCSGNIDAWQRKYMGIGQYSALSQLPLYVFYAVVSVTQGVGTSNNIKSVYDFAIYDNNPFTHPTMLNMSNYGKYNFMGRNILPTRQTNFKFTPTSTYEPESRIYYTYESYLSNSESYSKVFETRRFVEPGASFCSWTTPTTSNLAQFDFMNYTIQSQTRRKISQRLTTYTSGTTDSISQLITYAYSNNSPLLVASESMTGSDGRVYKTQYDYPDDVFNETSLIGGSITSEEFEAYASLGRIGLNAIQQPVQITRYVNSSIVEITRTLYKDHGNNIILPKSVQRAKGSLALEAKQTFTKYDIYGRLSEWREPGGFYHTAINDYKGERLIASVTNAEQNDVAYTSFEGDNLGGWEITTPGAIITDLTSPSGLKVYRVTSSNKIRKELLQFGKSYILTYWAKSPSAASLTAGTAATIIRNKGDGWYQYRKIVSSASWLEFSSSSTIEVDELRLYPVGSLMTSYVYDRAGNVIVEVSPDDHVLYSFYDGFSRLRYVKNQNGEYLVSYCYNQAGQPIDCEATGTPPTFPPPPVVPPEPTPEPPPPIMYRMAATSSGICNDALPADKTLFYKPSDGKYYSNHAMTSLAATGYYRQVGSKQYLYIVNGVLTATGFCPPD